jgi:carboxypeptidase Taq
LPLKTWLNKEIHWVGKMENADTIVRRVTGEPLNATYFVDYLWRKYGEIFSITRP